MLKREAQGLMLKLKHDATQSYVEVETRHDLGSCVGFEDVKFHILVLELYTGSCSDDQYDCGV